MNRADIASALYELRAAVAATWNDAVLANMVKLQWQLWAAVPGAIEADVAALRASLSVDFGHIPAFRDTLTILGRLPPTGKASVFPVDFDGLQRLAQRVVRSDEVVLDADDRRDVVADIFDRFPAMRTHADGEKHMESFLLPLRGFFGCQVASYMVAKATQAQSDKSKSALTTSGAEMGTSAAENASAAMMSDSRHNEQLSRKRRHALLHSRDADEANALLRALRVIERVSKATTRGGTRNGAGKQQSGSDAAAVASLRDQLRDVPARNTAASSQKSSTFRCFIDIVVARLAGEITSDAALVSVLTPVADAGLAWAQVELARTLFRLQPTTKDGHRAADHWYQRAAAIGLPAAKVEWAQSLYSRPGATPMEVTARRRQRRRLIDEALDSDEEWGSGCEEDLEAARQLLRDEEAAKGDRGPKAMPRWSSFRDRSASFWAACAFVTLLVVALFTVGVIHRFNTPAVIAEVDEPS